MSCVPSQLDEHYLYSNTSALQQRTDDDSSSAADGLEGVHGDKGSPGDERHQKDSSESSKMSLQERNRAAQKRFRARQKAKAQEKCQQLNQLREVAKNLLMRAEILEKELLLRDEQIANLQVAAHVYPYSQSGQAADEQLLLPSGFPQYAPLFTASNVQSLEFERLVVCWKNNTANLTSLCPTGQTWDETNKERVMMGLELAATMHDLLHKASILNPKNYIRLLGYNLETRQAGEEGDQVQHWLSAVQRMNLSKEQIERTIMAYNKYKLRIANLMEERALIYSSGTSANQYKMLTESCTAMELIQQNVRMCISSVSDLGMYISKHVLPLSKYTEAIILGYPYAFDPLAFAVAVTQFHMATRSA